MIRSLSSAPRSVVLESLRGMSDDRKCYRLVGGVLAERTVGEVRPDLEASQAGVRSLS